MEKSKIELAFGDLSVTVLEQFGGRIASIKLGMAADWISQPQAPLIDRNVGDNFIRPEISGWDEMVPTTDACPSLDGSVELPDHGEVWSRPWQVVSQSPNSCRLSIQLQFRPLLFSRTISLSGEGMQIGYTITNMGSTPVPAFWSCHPLFASEQVEKVEISPSFQLIQTTPQVGSIDQDFLPYLLPANSCAEFWCHPHDRIEKVTLVRTTGEYLAMSWNTTEIPYFGIFIDNKEFSKVQLISPQPAIAYRVSEREAELAKLIPILKPGETKKWGLILEVGNQ